MLFSFGLFSFTSRLLARLLDLKASPRASLYTDTFFTVPQGRLKLRDFGNQMGELIRYHRPDADGPKVSDYAISPTNDPQGLADLLAAVLPVLGVVRKKRTLFLSGRTRIHLDEVRDQGWFMELKIVLSDGES